MFDIVGRSLINVGKNREKLMNMQEVIGILLSLTALASYINYRFIKLPKSIGLTLITLILSLIIAASSSFGWDMQNFTQELLNIIGFNETFLHGMLSFLLFAGALHVNTRELAKHKIVVGLLATVGVVLSTFIIGLGTYGLTKALNIPISFIYCLLFGALISPTDPISVLGILKEVNAPKNLEMKIAGEALFNDGMGIVLFMVILGMATGVHSYWSLSEISVFFIQQKLGGIVLGAILGSLTSRLLNTIDDSEVAIILTLALVAGGYTLAHKIAHVSGAICIAMAGLVVGGSLKKGKMSKEALYRLDAFWALVDAVLNAILFVLIGLEFLNLHFTPGIWLASVGTIIITLTARWISVIIPVGSISLFRKFNPAVIMVMTWGGLRGGISIALALSIPQGPIRDFIVSITYAVVIFSITVQGLTIGPLVKLIFHKDSLKLTMPIPLAAPIRALNLNFGDSNLKVTKL
ncbi:MAG: NhaP-type Na+(K+)/H+ antiporter [Francisellaceae bacterium]|nr:NhaP-type Na+(K+)/H+ antiporter [Francisellaceae bacterium]